MSRYHYGSACRIWVCVRKWPTMHTTAKHTNTQTHRHTHKHQNTQTHKHKHTLTHKHANKQTDTQTHTHTHTHTHRLTHNLTHAHTHTRPQTRSHGHFLKHGTITDRYSITCRRRSTVEATTLSCFCELLHAVDNGPRISLIFLEVRHVTVDTTTAL